jgi:two-component system response regulator HydG
MDVAVRSNKPRVLVVDDDRALVETLTEGLIDHGYTPVGFGSSREAMERLPEEFDALVTDLRMPGVDGLELLGASREAAPERPVIVITAYSAVDTAIESIRRGAYHYLTKPFKVDELALFLGRAIEESRLRREASVLKRALRDSFALANIVGRGGAMREVCDLAERVATSTTPVLITGETGTGKGLLARAIHAMSTRAPGNPFVAVNCAAVPESLLESELFGHTKGAFTGATATRKGLFEEAAGGTLFLDEIGEMPLVLQAKLLHVLEGGRVRAVRVVTATHRDLHARAAAGAFREDLLFRLDVVTLEVPPLRCRKEDFPALLAHFLAQSKARHPTSPATRFSPEASARLIAHGWPGNVRELENVIERCVLLGKSAVIAASELPAALDATSSRVAVFDGPVVPLAEVQRLYMNWALEQLGGKKMLTAEKLDVDRKTLLRMLGKGPDEG